MLTVRDYQRAAIGKFRRQREAAFFMEMRLGKTLTATRWVERKVPQHVIICCPLSAHRPWLEHLKNENLPAHDLRNDGVGPGWNVVNYDQLTRRDYHEYAWDAIILDESVAIRNPRSKLSQLMLKEYSDIPIKAILTGYAAPESLLDLVQQFIFLNGNFCGFRNYYSFRNAMCYQVGYQQVLKESAKGRMREHLAEHAYALTREEAGLDPGFIYEQKYCYLDDYDAKLYREMERTFQDPRDMSRTKYKIVVNQWLARVSGGPEKLRLLMSVLEELGGAPAPIWFRYNDEIAAVESQLFQRGISYGTITGDTKSSHRAEYIDLFQKGHIKYLLCQQKCSKYGLDFSAADVAIYYSCGYEGDDRQQSMARIVDVAKTKPVLVIDLICDSTIDEDIRLAVLDKATSQDFILDAAMERTRRRMHA